MDFKKLDTLLKFILAAAGEEDWDNRQLGPIHLIKYVYLADLAYAKRHEGKTFTGIKWKFYRFGPYADEVYARIEPVAQETCAQKRTFSHPKYADDFVKYILSDESLYKSLERQLPWEIVTAVKQGIRKFGDDTPSLLDFVYRTEPMLRAAPGEYLSFEELSEMSPVTEDIPHESKALSFKAKKKRKQKIAEIKQKLKERLAKKKSSKKLIEAPTPPRYDEVFEKGTKWLDDLAGEPIEEETGLLTISEEFWKSPARFDPNVS